MKNKTYIIKDYYNERIIDGIRITRYWNEDDDERKRLLELPSKPLGEGDFIKGGLNSPPETPRPSPPKGQGVKK